MTVFLLDGSAMELSEVRDPITPFSGDGVPGKQLLYRWQPVVFGAQHFPMNTQLSLVTRYTIRWWCVIVRVVLALRVQSQDDSLVAAQKVKATIFT